MKLYKKKKNRTFLFLNFIDERFVYFMIKRRKQRTSVPMCMTELTCKSYHTMQFAQKILAKKQVEDSQKINKRKRKKRK